MAGNACSRPTGWSSPAPASTCLPLLRACLQGTSDQPVWLSDFACSGSEAQLADCPSSNWGVNSCSHQKDVVLFCYGR